MPASRLGVRLHNLWLGARWRLSRWLEPVRLRHEACARWLRVPAAKLFRRTVSQDGVVIPLGPHVTSTILRCMLSGNYEREELEVVRRTISHDDVVLELGTGLGFLSAYCAQRVGSARVFTFEANPALEPHIRRTFARNSVSPTLQMAAVERLAGTVHLNVQPDFWASSTVTGHHAGCRLKVPVEPLAGVLGRIRPTFLIVDIEGGELALLDGAALEGVRKICMEVHGSILGTGGLESLGQALQRAGFARDDELSTERVWFLTRPSPQSPDA